MANIFPRYERKKEILKELKKYPTVTSIFTGYDTISGWQNPNRRSL